MIKSSELPLRVIWIGFLLTALTPALAVAADFRLTDSGPGRVSVIDFDAIKIDPSNVRHFVSHGGATDALETRGGQVKYVDFSFAFDCKNRRVRGEGILGYDKDFHIVDRVPIVSPWRDITSKQPPLDQYEIVCGVAPGEQSQAARLTATDWQSAMQEALAKIQVHQ